MLTNKTEIRSRMNAPTDILPNFSFENTDCAKDDSDFRRLYFRCLHYSRPVIYLSRVGLAHFFKVEPLEACSVQPCASKDKCYF